jgi:hypothetical protein
MHSHYNCSSVSIETRLWTGRQGNRGSVASSGTDIFLEHTQSSIPWVLSTFTPKIKRRRRESIPPLPPYDFVAVYLVEHKGKFAFYTIFIYHLVSLHDNFYNKTK